jgi:hypothetical protein
MRREVSVFRIIGSMRGPVGSLVQAAYQRRKVIEVIYVAVERIWQRIPGLCLSVNAARYGGNVRGYMLRGRIW